LFYLLFNIKYCSFTIYYILLFIGINFNSIFSFCTKVESRARATTPRDGEE
jgi:hypothetical protein